MRRNLARVSKLVVAGAIAVMALPGAALADPISLTSGGLFISRQNEGDVDFASDSDFRLRGTLWSSVSEDGPYYPPYFCGGEGCSGPVNLSMSDSLTWPPPFTPVPGVLGSFTTGGEEYWLDTFAFDIEAGDILTPTNGTAFTWFRLTGSATGTTLGGASATIAFAGGGRASSFWTGNNGWLATEYRFGETAPVPEPATMLLLGSGLAGIAGARKRLARRRA